MRPIKTHVHGMCKPFSSHRCGALSFNIHKMPIERNPISLILNITTTMSRTNKQKKTSKQFIISNNYNNDKCINLHQIHCYRASTNMSTQQYMHKQQTKQKEPKWFGYSVKLHNNHDDCFAVHINRCIAHVSFVVDIKLKPERELHR